MKILGGVWACSKHLNDELAYLDAYACKEQFVRRLFERDYQRHVR